MKNLSLIFCRDKNNLIGLKLNSKEEYVMPWGYNNKTDLKYFKEQTIGKSIIMGYNTYISLKGRVLSDRLNIVVTQKHYDELKQLESKDFKVCSTIEECFALVDRKKEFFIIGGKLLFDKYWEEAETIYETEVIDYVPYIEPTSPLIIEKHYIQSIDKNKYKIVSNSMVDKNKFTIWKKIK